MREPMFRQMPWIPFRRSINDVVPFRELCQQPRDLLRRLLQVVVHRDDDVVAARTNAAQECVVLTVVAHQVDALISGWRPHSASIVAQLVSRLPSLTRMIS